MLTNDNLTSIRAGTPGVKAAGHPSGRRAAAPGQLPGQPGARIPGTLTMRFA